MADHPLRPANHRRLGRPLPYQLANGTQAHLSTVAYAEATFLDYSTYPVLAHLSECYSRCQGRLLTRYSPVRHSTRVPKNPFAFDLHVLSTPPAFVLSQDQTLQFDILDHPQRDGILYSAKVYKSSLCSKMPLEVIQPRLGPFAVRCYSVFKDRFAAAP